MSARNLVHFLLFASMGTLHVTLAVQRAQHFYFFTAGVFYALALFNVWWSRKVRT